MMTYSDLLKKRRSVRDFENKPIPISVINEILQESCLAPSACNIQSWRFIIVQDLHLMKKISDEAKRVGLKIANENPASPFCRFKNNFINPDYYIFYNAPVLILIVGENNYPFFFSDCACAATYLMFAATSRNLGTCWIGHAHNIEDLNLRKEIGIPDDHQIAAALIIGYPKSIPASYTRNNPIILKTVETKS